MEKKDYASTEYLKNTDWATVCKEYPYVNANGRYRIIEVEEEIASPEPTQPASPQASSAQTSRVAGQPVRPTSNGTTAGSSERKYTSLASVGSLSNSEISYWSAKFSVFKKLPTILAFLTAGSLWLTALSLIFMSISTKEGALIVPAIVIGAIGVGVFFLMRFLHSVSISAQVLAIEYLKLMNRK